jgi:hypothetical protein
VGSPDPFLTYLKKFGYCVVRHPRANVQPLQLITKKGSSYHARGSVTTVFDPGDTVPLPAITQDVVAANINGQKSGNLKIGVGLNLLGNIISAMGGSPIGLKVAYERTRYAVFEFDDVLRDEIDVAALDQFLTDADVDPFSTHLEKMLEADRVYVTTSTIKSKKFTITAKDDNEVGIDVSIPVIEGIVGGQVEVGGSSDSTATVTYSGSQPLVFGFQAVRLFYKDGVYTAMAQGEPGDAGLEALEPGTKKGEPEHLITESPFVGLELD